MAWQTQNFLHRATLVDQLIRCARIGPDDLVLDLGAGHGELTQRLARRSRKVIAIESDPHLAARLQLRFGDARNVTVRNDDALATRLPHEQYKVVSNIPFDVTARLIRRLTSAKYAPVDAFLAVQREAAERVLGYPRETLFGMLIKPWFEPSIVHNFRRTDFRPAPRVDVVFLRLHKRGPPLVQPSEAEHFRAFVTLCFCAPTRNLQATLAPMIGYRRFLRAMRELQLEPTVTPSAVPLEAWVRLAAIARQMAPGAIRPGGRAARPSWWPGRRSPRRVDTSRPLR